MQPIFWRFALLSNGLTAYTVLAPIVGNVFLNFPHILQGTLLIGAPILFVFGILLILFSLRTVSCGIAIPQKLIGAILFCLFLAALGVIGTGAQILIIAFAGSNTLLLLVAGAVSMVLVGVIGLGSQVLARFSDSQLRFLGGALMVIGVLSAIILMALLLFPYAA